MKTTLQHREEGKIHIRVFWLTSIILSIVLTLVINAVIFLFNR